MAIEFTAAELAAIEKQRKPASDLPVYFSASLNRDVQITRDFESYLILQKQSQKQRVLSWIRNAISIQAKNVDRDALLAAYIGYRQADAQARLADLDKKIANFDSFRSDLLSNGGERFAIVSELSQMILSLQKPLDEITIYRDRAYHENVLATLLLKKQQTNQYSTGTQRELQSWQTVISAYTGQAG